jgi:DGQHR domain-containing protein
MGKRRAVITLNALRVEQRADIPIFVFGINGRLIFQIASVSFAERTKAGTLRGYQRLEVKKHIKEIHAYLSDKKPLLPNAIVLAFDERVSFEPLRGQQRSEWGTFGKLTIPLPINASEQKVGWIVDGQQRANALSQLDVRRHFPVVVVAFQSPSPELQREQFLLVNKTKPLPRDLLSEILPEVEGGLPRDLDHRRHASKVLQKLRFAEDSPFFGRVRGLGSDGDNANISQNAILSVINDSIRRRGVLFDHCDTERQRYNYDGMAATMNVFFEGVRRTWPTAWDANPKTSRLVHGVGVVALGHVMDRVMREVDAGSPKAASMVVTRLAPLAKRCAWSKGRWPVLNCAWNELQNTSQDKARLTDFLLKEYAG